ncbi:hypothetical protein TVAG_412550 [Trichomonas vaginalis G3]|uniref:UBA domain-containing protein n=1 Tax=Trichomonas vaginalis (strain ATCC PRA-98 / G3) TaxID=412133 RepID=A2EV68_TRIV3|nr:NAD+ ADP-ribosyltransferase protein [Trichomonas vaginalis G3]EAY03451.1 hypothetical protein TVAG_412550 [Trichomonas vaginalis G3]KAI5486185.1 NAD+ ADP-ribosyltransferase protein [Trichomonas vaginalis G3]|eukprot:XP_001315674.1 hypothetical protein [Trichomonas vaginalis G3]
MSENGEDVEEINLDEDEDVYVPNDTTLNANATILQNIVNNYNLIVYSKPAQLVGCFVRLSIPKSFLPLSIQTVLGFFSSENILDIDFELDGFNWKKKPISLDVSHPIYKKQYIGRVYIESVINKFFSENYKPKQYYKSAVLILSSPGTSDSTLVNKLSNEGYDLIAVENVLKYFNNNYENAQKFLMTGECNENHQHIAFEYNDCPLLYLTLEICEAFLGIYNHCIICGDEIDMPGIKPTTCKKQLCNFTFQELGVGNSLYSEIQRDQNVADLLLTLFACALDDKYYLPCPTEFELTKMKEIFQELPSLKTIMENCQNDNDIQKFIGDEPFNLVKWIILSNRAQIYCLPNTLKPSIFNKDCIMFMTFLSSPQKDENFNKLKSSYGSTFLFHGSHLTRWHSILRNGLVNATGTNMEVNGSKFGPGIYFSRESDVSLPYARNCENKYINSALGRVISLMSLCEVAKTPDLKDQGRVHTLQDANAVIVRFILVNVKGSYDVIATPPIDIPTIKDVLELQKSSN